MKLNLRSNSVFYICKDTQKNRTKVLLFFNMTKYFDKKVPKNMFFNIL
jgi:hypothetical protein